MYSKKLRRVVHVSEATRPPEVTMEAVTNPERDNIFLRPQIVRPVRPIAQYPVNRMVVQPTRLLSHHGFTPPRIVPTPPVASTASTASTAPSNPIFLGPRGDVELAPVAPVSVPPVPPAVANASTTFTIIVSHNTQPPVRHIHAALEPLPAQASAIPESSTPVAEANSERPRKRRQRADDLVPAGCGLTREDIVELPIDDFNDKVAEKSEKEIIVLKDKRRKGKNRVIFGHNFL